LENLRAQHREKEEIRLRLLISKSLNILGVVLQSKQTLQPRAEISSLDHLLFNTETSVSADVLYRPENSGEIATLPPFGQLLKWNSSTTKEAKWTGAERLKLCTSLLLLHHISTTTTKPSNYRCSLLSTTPFAIVAFIFQATHCCFIRLLSLLCGINTAAGFATMGARPPSLVGYLGPQAEAARDAYMTKLNNPLTNEVQQRRLFVCMAHNAFVSRILGLQSYIWLRLHFAINQAWLCSLSTLKPTNQKVSRLLITYRSHTAASK